MRSVDRILRRFREKPIGGARTRTLTEHVVRSDAAMYEAKKKGKNCVVLARDGKPAP